MFSDRIGTRKFLSWQVTPNQEQKNYSKLSMSKRALHPLEPSLLSAQTTNTKREEIPSKKEKNGMDHQPRN